MKTLKLTDAEFEAVRAAVARHDAFPELQTALQKMDLLSDRPKRRLVEINTLTKVLFRGVVSRWTPFLAGVLAQARDRGQMVDIKIDGATTDCSVLRINGELP